jgi:hypothetical protein
MQERSLREASSGTRWRAAHHAYRSRAPWGKKSSSKKSSRGAFGSLLTVANHGRCRCAKKHPARRDAKVRDLQRLSSERRRRIEAITRAHAARRDRSGVFVAGPSASKFHR